MSDLYYSANNARVLMLFLQKVRPSWIIVGGPADGCEAQLASRWWPGLKAVGIEPNPEAVAWQREHGWWPEGQPLIQAALAERDGETARLAFEPRPPAQRGGADVRQQLGQRTDGHPGHRG